MHTRLTPSEPFPEDLTALELPEVQVLHSKLQRELSSGYVAEGEPDPETSFRNEELTTELDRRDAVEAGTPAAPLLHAVQLPVDTALPARLQ